MSIDGRHLFSFFALAFVNTIREIDQFFYTGSEI